MAVQVILTPTITTPVDNEVVDTSKVVQDLRLARVMGCLVVRSRAGLAHRSTRQCPVRLSKIRRVRPLNLVVCSFWAFSLDVFLLMKRDAHNGAS